jgi:hypothetical protein
MEEVGKIGTTKQKPTAEEGTKGPGLSRRDLFRLGAAAAATTTLGNEFAHEESLAERGYFETNDAQWYPIYERHDQHVKRFTPGNIPPVDAISIELAYGSTTRKGKDGKTEKTSCLGADPLSLLLTRVSAMDTGTTVAYPLIPTETLEHLKKNEIPVAFGDVAYTDNIHFFHQNLESALKVRTLIGIAFVEFGLLKVEELMKTAKISRRRLFRLLGASLTTMGATALLPNASGIVMSRMMKAMDPSRPNSPEERIWARFKTITNDLFWENFNGLLRELLQAKKLITLAKEINRNKPEKAKIAYNWQLAHRGIEDWLRLGEDVIRACILTFPDDVLKQVIKANGNDPRVLYAMRLIQVPKSLKIEQKEGVRVAHIGDEEIRDTIIEDRVLAKMLEKRNVF